MFLTKCQHPQDRYLLNINNPLLNNKKPLYFSTLTKTAARMHNEKKY